MRTSRRPHVAPAALLVVLACGLTGAPAAAADPLAPPASPNPAVPTPPPAEGQAAEFGPGPHNVLYRARIDGVARGATITYKTSDTQANSANPTMIPGRTFETTGVVEDARQAGMEVSIQWPYSANLHCEIVVDGQVTAEADQFVAPTLTPRNDDPGYGALDCGSTVDLPTPGAEGDGPAPALPAPAPSAQ